MEMVQTQMLSPLFQRPRSSGKSLVTWKKLGVVMVWSFTRESLSLSEDIMNILDLLAPNAAFSTAIQFNVRLLILNLKAIPFTQKWCLFPKTFVQNKVSNEAKWNFVSSQHRFLYHSRSIVSCGDYNHLTTDKHVFFLQEVKVKISFSKFLKKLEQVFRPTLHFTGNKTDKSFECHLYVIN